MQRNRCGCVLRYGIAKLKYCCSQVLPTGQLLDFIDRRYLVSWLNESAWLGSRIQVGASSEAKLPESSIRLCSFMNAPASEVHVWMSANSRDRNGQVIGVSRGSLDGSGQMPPPTGVPFCSLCQIDSYR